MYGVIHSRSIERNARYQVDIELCGDMLASRKWILSLNIQFQEVIFMGSDNNVSVVFFVVSLMELSRYVQSKNTLN